VTAVETAVTAGDAVGPAMAWLMAGMVAGTAWIVLLVMTVVILLIAGRVCARLQHAGPAVMGEGGRLVYDLVRRLVVTSAVLVAIGVALAAGWCASDGRDAVQELRAALARIEPAHWAALGLVVGQLVLVAVLLFAVVRVVVRLLRGASARAIAWKDLRDNDRSLERFFDGLERAVVVSAWLGFAAIACHLSDLPAWCGAGIAAVARIYAIIVIGILVLRATAVVVDTSEGLSRRYAEKRGWLRFYDHLRPLVPLLRRCLEYVLWIGIASLTLNELPKLDQLAEYGPRLIQAIGIFFIGRVVIEVGNLLIGRGMLEVDGLDDLERRRRATVVPLAKSVFRVGCWFGIFVLGLAALGFNPMPFLAGAGVLGIVVGFGAQSLIADVVGGFFILFENVYLVGDVVEAGGAKGTVEAIEFRTTKIRDADGRLHIIRNGDVKQVVNYSKDFTRAVVTFEVGYNTDLQRLFAQVQACGERLRAEEPDVLDAVQIDGITAFGSSAMTVRISQRVRPGRHDQLAARLRLLLKETFDGVAPEGAPRTSLVG
jgi:small conductance mechanosensitive channel